jgi:asparagine synthase (glutamine-hydrolysing)
MTKHAPHVHTFTVGFEGGEKRDDEVKKAVESANAFNAVCDTQVIREMDYYSFMESYLWHLEEPIGNESAAAYHFVAKLAQPKVKVLLSGQGADEPFAGYGRHRAARYTPLFNAIPRSAVALAGRALLPMMGARESPRRLIDCLLQQGEDRQLLSMYSIITPGMREQLFHPDTRKQINADLPLEYVRGQLRCAPDGTLLEKMAFIDARTSLPDNLLLCGDKMAMAASVEMRVPFLDLKVMDIAERIPGTMKVLWFKNKAIHKRVCEQWLPNELVHRRKIGFNNPMEQWLKKKLDLLLSELTTRPGSLTRSVLNPDAVRRLQMDHKQGIQDHQRSLFLLLSLEMWNKVFRIQ